MSYNFTKNHAQDVTNLSSLSSFVSGLRNKEINQAQQASFGHIRDSLKDLTPDAAADKLNKLSLNKTLKTEILEAASKMTYLAGTAYETAAAMTKLTAGSASGLSSLGSSLASFVSTPLGMATAVGAVTVGVLALADAFTVSHDEALSSAQGAVQDFANTQAELSSLNSQYDINKQKISELQALKASGLSTPETDAELSRLQAQTEAIEAQIAAKENLLEISGREASKKGEEYLGKKEQASASLYDDKGNKYTAGSKAAESNGVFAQNLTDAEAIELSISKVDEFKSKLAELQEQQANAKTKGEAEGYQKDIDRYQEAIDDLETDMASRANNITSIISGMTNKTSAAYKDARKALDAYNTRGMSKSDKEQQSMDTFFDMQSTDSLKNYFTELARAGKLTEESFSKFGFSAESFGVENLSSVVEYFHNIAESADNAAESVSQVDGTISGISAAFQTKNTGDAYEQTGNYMLKAKELVEEGRWNTDDVKSVAKMIGADMDDIAGTFAERFQEMSQYFTFDDNGAMSEAGVEKFIKEYEALEETFRSTGETAKEMGLSAEAFEILMGRAQEHGTAFKDMVKSSEELASGQEALENLKLLSENMKGSDREDMELKIEGWEEQLSAYEEDLSSLDTTVIAQIEFAYDMAQLQADIEEAEILAKNTGSREDWGVLNAKKEIYRNEFEENSQFDDVVEPTEFPLYFNVEEAIEDLQSKISSGEFSDSEVIDMQEQISNYSDMLTEIQEAFQEDNPTITPETDMETADQAWSDWIAGTEGQEVLARITADNEEAINAIAELLDTTPEKVVSMLADTSDVDAATASTDGGIRNTAFSPLMGAVLGEVQKTDGGTRTTILLPDGRELVTETTETNGGTRTTIYSPDTKDLPSSFTPVTRKVNYVTGAITGAVKSVASTIMSGGIKANGSAHFSGTALSGGNWGLPQSGRSLINELGSEIIVRNGRWFVLNGGYPTLANLRAGDIIFNHRQSADILNHGYVTGSHARMVGSARAGGTAHSGGTAYAGGTKFSEQFDKIEILMERMESAFKKITDSVESLSYNLAAQNQEVDRAISQAKSNISSYQKAYDVYMQKANSVGLSASWQSIIRNGDYDIQEITNEKLKDQIDDYQKYYKKALNIQKDIADLQKELLDLAMQKLKNIDTYYSNRFDYNDDFGYANEVSEIRTALEAYTAELNRQLSSGAIIRYSDEWYDAQKEIADYTQKLLEAQWKKYESAIDHLSRVSDNLEDFLSLKEASGKPVTEADYQKQIDLNNQTIEESYNYRQKLVAQQAVYDVESDHYEKLAKEIASLDSDIYGLMEDNEKLKESIWDVRFTEPFKKVTDSLDDTISSTKSLRSLLDKDSFLDSFGNLTENGALNLALLNQEMTASKQKIAEYTAALKKLDEAYQNGIITQEAYEKSQADFLDEIQDAAGDVQDYKNDIIDLYKDQLKAEIDYMDEYYDKRKETLDLEEKYYEFSKKMQKQSKSVNQLKAQIAALQGVKNASAQAELRRLEQELAEEEADLQELKKDHERDVMDDQFDALSKGMNENLEKTLQELTLNSDKQTQVVSDMLNNMVGMYADAYNKIQQIIGSTGFAGNDGFNLFYKIQKETGIYRNYIPPSEMCPLPIDTCPFLLWDI